MGNNSSENEVVSAIKSLNNILKEKNTLEPGLEIHSASNGWILKYPPDGPDYISSLGLFQVSDYYSDSLSIEYSKKELEAWVNLLYAITDYIGPTLSKHDKYQLKIEIEEINEGPQITDNLQDNF